MQHPDEGTIHSWLDNALSAEEAARVESHVAECPPCAAAVAEARGFIAASSRILTALDDIPRGVVPAVPARKRDLRVLWRAAAAVLVVAGGSFIVMRDGGQEMRPSVATSDSVVGLSAPSTAVDERAAAATGVQTTRPTRPGSADRDLSRESTLRRTKVSTGKAAGQAAGTDTAVLSGAPVRPTIDLSANTFAAQRPIPPLKELNVEQTPGTRRIVYQISATDTVTLTEIESPSLQSVVTTGAASAQDRQQQALRTRDAVPTRTEVAAAAPPQIAPPARNTVRWVESATGTTLILSGSLSVEKLQEIKQRIEKEREAARKKSP